MEAIADETGADIVAHGIGHDIQDVEGDWLGKYGVTAAGAVLVRPDGIIAWRATGADETPQAALKAALRQILGMSSTGSP